MGYYIEVPYRFRKAEQIAELYGGQIIGKPESFDLVPEDKALIVVVRNPFFEAAALAYDESEFKEFTDPLDERPKQYVVLGKAMAYKLAGYTRAAVLQTTEGSEIETPESGNE